MSDSNNDTYTVGQFNGMQDNDANLNGISVTQGGTGPNIAFDNQTIDSGGNTQTNTSNIVDSGLFTFANNSANDTYTVGQSNNMFDNDQNANAFHLSQLGGANVAIVGQDISSGGNTQDNASNIFDGGFSGFLGGNSNNDHYTASQFNGMADNDGNQNGLSLTQNSIGPFTADLAFVGQVSDSGGNSQSNASNMFDGGLTGLFGGNSNNDSYTVGQSNQMLDNDQNFNLGTISQTGTANLAFLGQEITSGGNTQGNASNLFDFGASPFGGAGSNNDTFTVGQQSQMADNDGNANSLNLGQSLLVNINGTTQTIDSGGNSQANASDILDLGATFGFGNNSNNDHYTVSQGNVMIDNDINLNIGVVSQLGVGNVAVLDQGITSGGNTQTNDSNIFDTGLSLGGHNNNDTYTVGQMNQLVDSDQNQNLASITQLVGPSNFADFSQLVDSGHDTSASHSNIFDFGI